MTRLIALDIALRVGFAHDGPKAGVPITGVYDCRATSGTAKDGFTLGATFESFRRWLIAKIDEVKPWEIAFEAPLHIVGRTMTSQQTVRVLFGLAAMAEAVAYELDIPIAEGNIATIKKHFAGSAKADKAAMVARCRQLGWDVGATADHNRADAAALWSMAHSLRDPKWAPTATPLFARVPA